MTAPVDDTIDWWLRLRHGGQLLDRTRLDALPEAKLLPWNLPEKLRSAIIALPDEGEGAATGDELTALMDLLLEDVAGLRPGWLKGAKVGADYAETLLDGTRWKPRRVWKGPRGGSLYVFTTKVRQVGLHKGRRPVAQITEYLRRRGAPLGLLTNGRQWRLIYADADTQAWAEWNTSEFFSAGQISDSVIGFARLLGWQALVREQDAARSPLLSAIAETRQGQAKLSSELGERVRKAVEALLVSRRPVLEEAWEELDSQAVYVAACHFVMRLVVTLFAEARGLLPEENPVYHNAYGITGLLESLDRVSPLRLRSRHTGWSRLLALYALLYKGSPHPALNLPAYGGDLFRPGRSDGDDVQRALHILESTSTPPNDEVIHSILVMLTRTTVRVRDGRSWRRVSEAINFTDLSSEYIGILYEGLLDYELHRAGDDAVLFLNLGDQPALPITRLEEMDDKSIKALVEKVKDAKGLVLAEEEEESGEPEGSVDEDAATDADPEDEADDLRETALRRAMTWARRAVKVGKLVKKAKGKDPLEQQQRAADSLIADLKLPGELYLVRWGGTRKGAGTFYTRPQLTMPTVRRTLEPLTREDGSVRTPEEILQLKIVDPAMGSGSFLVAALRVLTQTIIEGAYIHGRVHPEGNRTRVEIDTLAESDRVFRFAADDPRFAEDFEDCIKRYVVEHCLYGVDIDPLAVELARVALWVETLDDKLPFTFLDHKLKVGNSLVGCWMDRFRDYPALAWERESPDKDHKGVHHAKNTWHKALAAKKKSVTEELKSVISGQAPMTFEGGDDLQVHEDVERLRKLFAELHRVPADQPARRARLYRTRIQTDPALGRLREAFDTWCALWFWPLDQLDAAPMPGDFLSPNEPTRAVSRRVAQTQHFFHWELEFPDVFHSPDSGFDAVLANPPWNIDEASSLEFFTNVDPMYRSYDDATAAEVREQVFRHTKDEERKWLAYLDQFKARSNYIKNLAATNVAPRREGKVTSRTRSGPRLFRLQSSGNPNTYKMFVELAFETLGPSGTIGMVTPSGLYADDGCKEIRKVLLSNYSWSYVFGFENRKKIFPIDSRTKFCVFVAFKGGPTESVQCSFMNVALDDWQDPASEFLAYPVSLIGKVSPTSYAILEVADATHMNALAKLYSNGKRLNTDEGWLVDHSREFNMRDDVALFIRYEDCPGLKPSPTGTWSLEEQPDSGVLVPLYQGVMVAHYRSNRATWVSGAGKQAKWDTSEQAVRPYKPQFLMERVNAAARKPGSDSFRCMIRKVARATDERTLIPCVVPPFPSGHSLARLSPVDGSIESILEFSAYASSLVCDWIVRARIAGSNVSWAFLQDIVFPPPCTTLSQVIAMNVLRLIGANLAFSDAWLHLASTKTEVRGRGWKTWWAVTPFERVRLRCVLDAIVAELYLVDEGEFRFILSDCDHPAAQLSSRAFARTLDPRSFWRVDKDKHPELRHPVLSLVACRDIRAMIDAYDGDQEAGIRAFCEQNDGDGWMLPETLRLADYDLGHDGRAKEHQPVASVLGPRFLEWQLAQTPEESWAECERHACALPSGQASRSSTETSDSPSKGTPPSQPQMALGFGEDE